VSQPRDVPVEPNEPQHWTLEMAQRIAEMTKAMRVGRVPERSIDLAVAKYIESTAPAQEEPA
jgi:hypothetical protein